MGRSRKKAARRKMEAHAGLVPLAAIPRREPNGKPARPPKDERGADMLALDVRAKQMGWADATQARAQTLEGPSGRALHLACDPEELRQLWQVWSAFRAARLAYHARILGVGLYAKTARLEMLPDRVEVRDDDRPDLRTQEERDAQARDRWAYWRGQLGTLEPRQRDVLRDAVAETAELVRDAALTGAGALFVDALRALARIVERRK